MDELDHAIARSLRVDARQGFAEIAEAVGLSSDAVRVRVGKLIDDGELRIVGVVDPAALGYRVLANVLVRFHGAPARLADALRKHDEVTFLATTVGSTNVLCEVVATDDAALADFVANEIATSPGVVGIETVRTAEIVKWVGAAGAPRQSSPPAEESLDGLDVAILRELARDPRLKVRRLAEMVDAPYTAVRRRSARLFESGIVEAVAVTERSDSVVAVTLLEARATAEVLPSVAALPDVSIVSRTIGRFSAVVEISAASTEAVVRSLDEIEALPGVVRLESLIVARSLKLATPWKFLRRSISAS